MKSINRFLAEQEGLLGAFTAIALGVGTGFLLVGCLTPREGLKKVSWDAGMGGLMASCALASTWGYALKKQKELG